jgi:hypothetical protein
MHRDDSNILSCIPIANIFIEAGMENGGILVHCIGGRSRSAALIAGYLMSSLGYTYDDALALIVCARPVASINRGFEIQLRAYSQNNYDVYQAQQILVRSRIRALHNIRGSKSSIEIIAANIEANNLKLLNHGKQQRKISDGEVRIIAPNSISKPINRASFSPYPDASLHQPDLSNSISGSGQKRTWVDSSNGNDDAYTNAKHHDAPEQDNDMLTTPNFTKQSVRDLLVDVKSDTLLEPNGSSSTNGSISVSAFATKSNSRSSSFVGNLPGRDAGEDLVVHVAELVSSSRRNSASLSKDPSLKALFDSPSQQSFSLPKIMSKSPSISDTGPVSNRNKGSRKNSLDSGLTTIPMPALHTVGRSKSLFPPASDSLGQSPIVQKSKTPVSNNSNHNLDSHNQTMLSPLLSSRRSSNYALDTSDIQGSPRVNSSSSNVLPKPDSFHIAGKSSSDLSILPDVNSGMNCQTPSKESIDATTGRNKPSISISSYQEGDGSYDYNGMKDGETPTPNYAEHATRRGSKGKGEAGGFQSIIREYIPLFDSKTPNIRYSRPGVAAVRVIPPLRGLDKGFCCSWCSASLFSLGNVVRVDFDAVAATRAGGFNILPTKEENRRLVHIPTSTTSKTTGLFIRKRSIDMAAAMIDGHNTIIQQLSAMPPPSTGTKPKSRLDEKENPVSTRNNDVNQTDKGDFNMDDTDEEGDTLASLDQKPFDKSKVSFKPIVKYVPPPSTRSRQSKAFDFDDSSEQPIPTEENGSMEEKEMKSPSFLPPLFENAQSQEKLNLPSTSNPIAPDSTCTPTSARSSVSSRSLSPFVANQYPSESPRINIPAKINAPTNEMTLSVEKKRWMDRVNLLRSSNSDKLSAMADADDEAQSTALSHEKYIFLEYLEWMGVECFTKEVNFGDINCYGCKRAIGSWTWTPSEK